MERVRILLRTRNDVYPAPRSASAETIVGAAPGSRVPCGVCLRSGRRRNGKPCLMCDGTGWRRRRKGEPHYDEYLGTEVDTAATKRPEGMSPQRIDAELERLGHSLKLSEGLADPEEAYGWERNRERRDKGASYAELDRVLEALRAVRPFDWDFITWVYGSGLDVELDRVGRAWEERIVAAIAQVMSGAIRIPRREHEELKDRKRREILALAHQGLEAEEIAAAVPAPVRWVRLVLAEVQSRKTLVP